MNPQDLKQRVLDIIAGKSRGYVEDARVLATVILPLLDNLDHMQTIENLTATQTRCTELIRENRRLKHQLELKGAAQTSMDPCPTCGSHQCDSWSYGDQACVMRPGQVKLECPCNTT
jgi:hypothetical protein